MSEPAREAPAWDKQGERGSLGWIRFIVWGIRAIGYHSLHLGVAPTALYFTLFGGSARSASLDYLAKLRASTGDPRRPTWLDVYRHVHDFAECILDRLSLWSGSIDAFEFELEGLEHLEKPLADGRGAFLVGAHVGSFDMLRGIALDNDIPVNVITYSTNAENINDAFDTLDPDSKVRLIHADSNSTNVGFEVGACLSRGELVATLADRVPSEGDRRVRSTRFLGHETALPEGPFLLPLVLGVPCVLVVAIRTGPRAYRVHIEPIGDGERVPRGEREPELERRVSLFVEHIERFCRAHPTQWFNFYDFWDAGGRVGDAGGGSSGANRA